MAGVYVNDVVGFTTTGSNPTRVVVYGVATTATSLDVILRWGSSSATVHASFTGLSWFAEYLAGSHYQAGAIQCDQEVDVSVPGFDKTVPLYVLCSSSPTCPQFKDFGPADVGIRECNAQSLRQITVTAKIDDRPLLTRGRLAIRNLATNDVMTEDLLWPAHHTSATADFSLPQGRYLAQVVTTQPGPCYGPTVMFEAPLCGCPVIVFGAATVTTGANGQTVAGSAEVRVEDGNRVSAQLYLVADTAPYTTHVARLDGRDHQTATFTLAGSAPNVAAGSYRLAVEIGEPAVCTSAVRDPIVVAGSTPVVTVVCPTLTLEEPKIGDCANGKRQVTARATVAVNTTPVGATLELRGASGTIELQRKQGQMAQFDLVGSADVAPGDYTVAVKVDNPANCPETKLRVTVPPCPTKGNGNGNGNGHPPEIPWCAILGVAAIFMTAFGLAMFAFFFCVLCYADLILAALVALGAVSAGSTSVVALVIVIVLIVLIFIGEAIAIAGTILFLIWLFTCGSCRTNCGLLHNFHWLFVYILIPLWGIIGVLGSLGGRPCGFGWFIGLADWVFLDAVLLYYGAAVGCFQWAPAVPNFLRLRIPDPVRIACGDR